MVARIRSGKTLKGAVNYNEKKLKEGKAELISAQGYTKEIENLNFHEKLNRLQKLADLNTRTDTHCLHVSLNFDLTENLAKERLQQIVEAYMNGIGFGGQPFLVYQHHDAAHQHIHIVTTNIKKDGKRISLHNLGRAQSEKTRKQIEISFGLVKASDRQQKQLQPLKPVNLSKAIYGKMETKRAISNIVTQVIAQYKFSSLPEFNAVLKQYNVIADRGVKGTRMFDKKGLQYSLLDEKGIKIGIPMKASSIYGRPILKTLEARFEQNKLAKLPAKADLKSTIAEVLRTKPNNEAFAQALHAKGIDVVFRSNDQNFIYGITYVDHNSKCVFNGSELGKEFSAAAILEKTGERSANSPKNKTKTGRPASTNPKATSSKPPIGNEKSDLLQTLEGHNHRNIPSIRKITEREIQDNYMQVKLDVQLIIDQEMENLRLLKKKQLPAL